jgi:hypothetical protein
MESDGSTRSPVRAGLLAFCRCIKKNFFFIMIPAGNIAYVNTSRLPALSSDARHFNKIKTTNRFGLSKLNGPVDIMLSGSEI